MATKKSSGKKRKGKNTRATLRLDSAFYPIQQLQEAKDNFSHLADIEIIAEGETQVVKFNCRQAELAGDLPDEFANYVLASMMSEQ